MWKKCLIFQVCIFTLRSNMKHLSFSRIYIQLFPFSTRSHGFIIFSASLSLTYVAFPLKTQSFYRRNPSKNFKLNFAENVTHVKMFHFAIKFIQSSFLSLVIHFFIIALGYIIIFLINLMKKFSLERRKDIDKILLFLLLFLKLRP